MHMPLFGRERPLLAPERPPLSESFWLNAMAAIAVGMFLGTWVIGPAVSGNPSEHASVRSAKAERQMLLAATARPDPSPYRTPTPDFKMPDAPRYGMLAREQAQDALGERGERRDAITESEPSGSTWAGFGAPKAGSNYRYQHRDRASDVSNY